MSPPIISFSLSHLQIENRLGLDAVRFLWYLMNQESLVPPQIHAFVYLSLLLSLFVRSFKMCKMSLTSLNDLLPSRCLSHQKLTADRVEWASARHV